MRGLSTAVGFLTRIPVRHHDVSSEHMAASVAWFPVVGLLVGAGAAVVFGAASAVLPPMAAAALALVASALLTGGFHEDGLADTADAFGGGYDAEQVRRILKDSRHGTFGVLALVASFMVKASCLAALPAAAGTVVLVAAHAGGRAVAVVLMGAAAPAGGDGLGSTYVRSVRGARVVVAAGIGLVSVGAALGMGAVVAAALGVVIVVVGERWSRRRVGGVVGDVLGSAEQLGEIVVLGTAAAMVGAGWAGWDAMSAWGGLLGVLATP